MKCGCESDGTAISPSKSDIVIPVCPSALCNALCMCSVAAHVSVFVWKSYTYFFFEREKYLPVSPLRLLSFVIPTPTIRAVCVSRFDIVHAEFLKRISEV